MKGRNRKYNEYKGITLIALVITIVVLIILAAISINMAFGSNGLITRAEEAKLQQKIADLQEMLDMEKMESLIDEEGHITIEDYLNHIKDEGIIGDEDIQDTDNEDEKYITVEDEYVFLVRDKNDGDVEIIYQGTAGNLLPNLQIEITNVTTSSITVKANASAMASGEYKYYIKNITKGEEEYTLKETSKTSEYTFEGLEEKNQYQIKVEATNPNGTDVKESGIIETTTIGEIEEQDIIFTYEPDGWTNGNVVVTADMSKITIPSGARVQTSKDASQWEDGNSQTFSENGEMYVRLYDGTNESNYAVAQVSKIDKTKPVINTVTSTQTTITIGATDEASGIIGYAVTTSNTEPTEFTTVTNTASLSTTISDLSVGTTYYVWVKDEAGNISAGKEIATQNYIVTYYIDTNSTQTQAFAPGESVLNGLNFTPSKSGYTFVGWREDTTASSSVLSSKTMGTSNITLYAVFSQTITLTYNGNGATGGSTANQSGTRYYNNGNAVNPSFSLRSNGFTRTNYAFQNWAMGSASGTKYNAGASVTLSSSTTFYATWVYATSTATLNWSGHYVSATGKVPASKPHNNGEGTASWGTGWSVSGTALSKSGYGIKANIPITGLKITGSINLGAVDGWTWYEGKVILCINGVEQRNLWYTGAYAGNGQDNLNDTTVNTTCNLNAGDVLTIECQGGTGGNDRTSIDLALTFSL